MISKRFSSSKKASKFSKRVLGMESLENRELLSINPLGYDGSDIVQTASNENSSQDFGTEAAGDISAVAKTGNADAVVVTATVEDPGASQEYTLWYMIGDSATKPASGAQTWVQVSGAGGSKTAASGDTSVVFDAVDTTGSPFASAANSEKYVFFTVAKGTTNPGDSVADGLITAGTQLPEVEGPAPGGADLTGASASGLTTNAVTVTWNKLDKADGKLQTWSFTPPGGTAISSKGYIVHVSDGTPGNDRYINVDTKTTVTLEGLNAETEYTIKIYYKTDVAAASHDVTPLTLGTVTTASEGTAADVKVGPVTGIAASYARAGKTPAGIKVTWKAPANYTGGYVVTVEDMAGNTTSVKVAAGAKTEALAIEDGTFKPTDAAYYKVSVVADATNAIAAPEVLVTVGKPTTDPPGAATVTPGDPTVGTTASGTESGTVIASWTANADGKAIGYWVGLIPGTTPPSGFDDTAIVRLVYVSGGADGSKTFGGLDATGATTYTAFVVAVSESGDLSALKHETTGATAKAPFTTTTADTATYVKDLKVTPSGTKATVTWKADPPAKTTDNAGAAPAEGVAATHPAITGWVVSYSTDGKNWVFGKKVDAATTTVEIDGLTAYNVKYQFRVEALIATTTTPDAGKVGKGADVTASKANVTKLDKVSKVEVGTIDPTADGATAIAAKWAKVDSADGYIVKIIDGKGVVWTGWVAQNASPNFDSSKISGLVLVPGVKYSVEVEAVQFDGKDFNSAGAAKASIATKSWIGASVKLDGKATLTTAKVTITPGKDMPSTGYYIEITSVVNAKGKADWNAASVYAVTGTSFTFDKVTEQLAPSTQYFVRVVMIAGGTNETDGTKSVIGKEMKFKTVAAPAATIGKSGFNVDATGNLGFNFDFKSPDMNDKNGLLKIDGSTASTFKYDLYVADASAKADKVTGSLGGKLVASGLELKGTMNADTGVYDDGDFDAVLDKNKKVVGYKLKDAIKFTDIVDTAGLDIANSKTLQFQFKVTYTNSTANPTDYATLYTKAGKLTMPKWFA